MRLPRSLHLWLWAIIALACLPVFLVTLGDYRTRRHEAVAALENDIARMLVAAHIAEAAEHNSLYQTFQIMARADNLQQLDTANCTGLAQRLLSSIPHAINLGAAYPDGSLFCSALHPDGVQHKVNDRAWFQNALQGNAMNAGEFQLGLLSGQPSIFFSYPMRAPDGQLRAVLFLALGMQRLERLLADFTLPPGWNALVLARNGTVLAQIPPPPRGQQPDHSPGPASALAQFFQAQDAGQTLIELTGLDGQERMYGISPREHANGNLLLAIGAPLERTVARIDRGLWLRLLLLAGVTLASALLARYTFYRLFETWTQRTLQVLARMSAGQLDARITHPSAVPELQALEQGINQMSAALAQREADLQRLSAAVEQSPVGMLITDTQLRILYANPAAEHMTGYTRAELLGQHPRLLHAGPVPESARAALWQALSAGRTFSGEFTNQRKDGSRYIEHTTVSPIFDPEGHTTHYVSAMEDISERKENEALIHRLAYYDELTQLPNRAHMHQEMARAIADGTQAGATALLLLDIDRFKHLNDTWGHACGDALLRQMAERLTAHAGPGAHVARLGSNTFAVLAGGLDHAPGEAARTRARALQQALAAPYRLEDGQRLFASTSAGIALLTAATAAPEQLLAQAEVAMYRAKAGGGGALELFDAAMQAQVDARAQLEMGLRAALESHAFALHYQAQIGPDGRVTGAEVLLRWSDAAGTPISPARFIPVAEETGLIVPIGLWVLQTACRQLARWQATPATRHLGLSVNVSARQFHQAEFVDVVRATLADSGADARGLTLELTESAILGGLDATIAHMHALRALGLRFALDDFGTGYSSLSYLQRLPFDELKIDQSFIRAMLADPTSSAIVRAIVALGDALGLQVIAEGVETAEHHETLTRLRCRHVQGYWFGRPMALADWERTHLGAVAPR